MWINKAQWMNLPQPKPITLNVMEAALAKYGFTFYKQCHCSGLTHKYRKGDYEVWVKVKRQRFNLQKYGAIIGFGASYNLEKELIKHGLQPTAEPHTV